ncbi:head decoration protein [Variovorax sp.]|jgi:hypothetical protein|uniref:head decoration protein n=1 Tax=Variovorax sp. TaxID=1871043 RepID=UPI004037FEA2
MPTINEGRHAGEHVASEANGTRSRGVVTIASGQNLEPGTVLGKVTASGKYVALAPAASDGSEAAAAVLYGHVDATTADRPGVVHLRDAELKGFALAWPSGITTNQKNTALGQLVALGLIAR